MNPRPQNPEPFSSSKSQFRPNHLLLLVLQNTVRATNFSIAVVDAKSVRIENNETESPYGIFVLNVGSNNGMIIKNNTVNASGGYYFGFGDLTLWQ